MIIDTYENFIYQEKPPTIGLVVGGFSKLSKVSTKSVYLEFSLDNLQNKQYNTHIL